MIELVLVFCLSASPADCREIRQPSENPTPIGCMIDAQRQAADWLADHPALGWIATTLGAALVALFLASPWVSRILGRVADPLGLAQQRVAESVDLAVAASAPLELPPEREAALVGGGSGPDR